MQYSKLMSNLQKIVIDLSVRGSSSSELRFYSGSVHKFKGFPEPPAMVQRRVVVTGLGLVTPLGSSVSSSWTRLVEGECGLRELLPEDLKLDAVESSVRESILKQLPSRVVASVQTRIESSRLAPFVIHALDAAREALEDSGWKAETDLQRERTGVAIGGGIGCISDILNAAQLLIVEQKVRRLSPFFIPRILVNMAAGHVSMEHGFMGPNHATVTACASGAHAIGDASRMIRYGDADVMLAGGSESSLDALSMAGFSRAKALSTKYNDTPLKASRPFDQDRDGFVMGEGAGILVLEEYEHAKQRGAQIYAEIRGYGMSGDAHHITQPPEDGRGAVLAMSRALLQAGLNPSDVDHVNAHATSTPIGDAVEARAIATVFGEHAKSGNLTISATKGATGHLLGAAGAVEAIFAVLALHHRVAPPTLNLEKPDVVFTGRFGPSSEAQDFHGRAAVTNSFGFGGTNASLLFSCPP